MTWVVRTLIFGSVLLGCSDAVGPDPIGIVDSISLTIESVVAELGAAASSTESGMVFPSAACSYVTARTCRALPPGASVRWGGCSLGQLTLEGGWNETLSSAPCCSSFGNSCVIDRETASTAVVLPSGARISISSDAHNTWDGSSIGGGVHAEVASSVRTITFRGLQRTFYSATLVQIFNHSLETTTSPIQVSGSLATNDRRVEAGTMVLHHNRVKYNLAAEFDATDKVTWQSASCCYPTTGKINGTLSGALSGSVTLQFTSTCGQATFTNQYGASSTITLNQCM